MPEFDSHQAAEAQPATVEEAGSAVHSARNRISEVCVEDDSARLAAPAAMDYDHTNFYFGAGTDPFALLEPFDDWWRRIVASLSKPMLT